MNIAVITCMIMAIILAAIGIFVMLYLKGSNTGVGFLAVCLLASVLLTLGIVANSGAQNTTTCPECETEVSTPFCSVCGWENTNMSFCAECGDNTAPLYCEGCISSREDN